LSEIHRLVASTGHRAGSESGPSTTPSTTNIAFRSLLPSTPQDGHDESEDDPDSDEYEGETSLHMQSIYARRFLEQAVGETNSVGRTNEISKAILTLQKMAEDKPSPRQRRNELFHNTGVTTKTDLSRLPLPPTDAVIYVLRKSRGKRHDFHVVSSNHC
jgi:hypothetical protein